MSSSANINSNEQLRDWLELPYDVTANILKRLRVGDILENVQNVCTAWRKVCKDDPAFWRVIKISSYNRRRISKQAVDRSQGQLLDLTIVSFNHKLLSYVAERSRQLKRLEIVLHDGDMLSDISRPLKNFPFLEDLNLYSSGLNSWEKSLIETAGRYCRMLKTLKLNQRPSRVYFEDADEVAIAIGENLHQLRHLELFGNKLSNIGLQAILDGCRHLETLDLRKCFNINLNGDVGKRCFKQIKCLKLPDDSLEGIPYAISPELYEFFF